MFENEFTWGKAVAENTQDEFHEKYEKAIEDVKNDLNKEYPIIINGKELFLEKKFDTD